MKVCDNPACEYNAIEMTSNPHGRVVEVLMRYAPWHTMDHRDKMQVKQITRHMYYNQRVTRRFIFAGVAILRDRCAFNDEYGRWPKWG